MKKIAAMFALMLILSSASAFFAIADETMDAIFNADAGKSQYKNSIIFLKNEGVISGYADGTFKPFNKINRAEFTKIVISATSRTPWGDSCFKDVKKEWFSGYICLAKEAGIINGYSDGRFRPNDNVNIAEALKITLNAFNITIRGPKGGETWYAPFIEYAENNNLYLDTFSIPSRQIRRDEMAELIKRLMDNPENAKILTSDTSHANQNNSNEPDISLYTGAIGLIVCENQDSVSMGSGFLMDLGKNSATGSRYNIFTNRHVIDSAISCRFEPEQRIGNGDDQPILLYSNVQVAALISDSADFAILPIYKEIFDYKLMQIEKWNWRIAHLPMYSPKVKVGTKVYTIGYPASSSAEEYFGDSNQLFKAEIENQIVTEGIISGYSNTNYFISNNIDHGNSGGAALALEDNEFCMLGMPTWLNPGVSSSLGIVLSFYNFFK